MRLEGEGTFVVGARRSRCSCCAAPTPTATGRWCPTGRAASRASRCARPRGRRSRSSAAGPTLPSRGGSELRASRAAIERLMAALADGRAESFLDDATGRLGDARAPVYTVTVAPRDAAQPRGRAARRRRLSRAARRRRRREDDARSRCRRAVARTLLEALGVDAAARSSTCRRFFAHADEIEELRIERLGGQARRRASTSRATARAGTSARRRIATCLPDESESANALALALADARAIEVLPPGAREPLRGALRASPSCAPAARPPRSSTSGQPARRRTALSAARRRRRVLRVTRAVARRFEPHPVALRGRARLADAVRRRRGRRASTTRAGPRRSASSCAIAPGRSARPLGLAADATSVADLLGALAHAKADAWVAESDDGGFGFERARRVHGDPRARRQRVGRRGTAPRVGHVRRDGRRRCLRSRRRTIRPCWSRPGRSS